MANSTFPVPIGLRNGAGRKAFDVIRNEQIHYPFGPLFVWTQIFTFADFAAASTTGTADASDKYPANAFPSNALIVGSWLDLIEVFAGGAVSAATMSMGKSGATTELQNAINVFTGQDLGLKQTNGNKLANGPAFEAAMEPRFTLTATGANTNVLTTGKFRAHILLLPLARLPQG